MLCKNCVCVFSGVPCMVRVDLGFESRRSITDRRRRRFSILFWGLRSMIRGFGPVDSIALVCIKTLYYIIVLRNALLGQTTVKSWIVSKSLNLLYFFLVCSQKTFFIQMFLEMHYWAKYMQFDETCLLDRSVKVVKWPKIIVNRVNIPRIWNWIIVTDRYIEILHSLRDNFDCLKIIHISYITF